MNFKNMPFDRYISNRINSAFVSLLCSKLIFDSQCGYRAIKVSVLKNLELFKTNRFEFETEFIIKSYFYGFKIGFIEIPVIYSNEKSHINRFLDSLRMIKLYLSIILSF